MGNENGGNMSEENKRKHKRQYRHQFKKNSTIDLTQMQYEILLNRINFVCPYDPYFVLHCQSPQITINMIHDKS